MHRIWRVALVALTVSAPALIPTALLSTNESARVRRVRQCQRAYHTVHGKRQPIRRKQDAVRSATRADLLWQAICMVESGGDHRAYNQRENAAGIGQIRPILVRDCNRICGYERFTLEDRWKPRRSREMFETFVSHYSRTGTDEEAARLWNGGPRGPHKGATLTYWRKVQAAMKKMTSCW